MEKIQKTISMYELYKKNTTNNIEELILNEIKLLHKEISYSLLNPNNLKIDFKIELRFEKPNLDLFCFRKAYVPYVCFDKLDDAIEFIKEDESYIKHYFSLIIVIHALALNQLTKLEILKSKF